MYIDVLLSAPVWKYATIGLLPGPKGSGDISTLVILVLQAVPDAHAQVMTIHTAAIIHCAREGVVATLNCIRRFNTCDSSVDKKNELQQYIRVGA